MLQTFGFTNVTIVEEQAKPDGNFPTVVYPNPEESEAMSIGLQKAKALDADILLGTDPDADRVGIGIKDNQGNWVLMNGNQTAVLAFNYLLEARRTKGVAQTERYGGEDHRYHRYDRQDRGSLAMLPATMCSQASNGLQN